MTAINKAAITEIAHKNDTSESVFHVLRTKSRNARGGVTVLANFKEQMKEAGRPGDAQEVLSTFRELERAGAGELTEGGLFKWKTPLMQVASAVVENGSLFPKTPTSVPAKPVAYRSTLICLDNIRKVEATYPANMSPTEIEDALTFLRKHMS